MTEQQRNALSRDAELTDHEFGRFFAKYVAGLFGAERNGIPVAAHPLVVKYMRRFHERLTKALGSRRTEDRHRSLASAAAQFRSLKGWREQFPGQAEACAQAFDALAADVRRPVGRPHASPKNPAYRYVRRAYEELIAVEMSQGRLDSARALFEPGSIENASRSRGRAVVAARAIQLAEADGVRLRYTEVGEQIRRYVKATPLPSFNYLASLRQRRPQAHSARPLIKAAGM